MKVLRRLQRVILAIVLFTATTFLFSNCSSKPKVDWNTRIGNFTYDQAVLELGPPAAYTKLDDGTVVADWFLKYGSSFSFGVGTGFYGGGGGSGAGVGVGQSVSTTPAGHYLRLTFGPDGKLRQWEKVKK